MSKGDRETVLSDLTSRIFSAMLGEIAMDTAIHAQKEVRRSMSVCKVCGMRCNQVHATPASATAPVPGTSRAGSPTIDSSSQPGTSTPGGTSKNEGNVNLDCVNCQRPIASNRYAQHLATCLGIGTGVRRTAQRTAVTKTKMNANERSASPYVEDAEEIKSVKGKSKAKGRSAATDEKQSGMPQPSPPKKQKKGKAAPPPTASGTGPPRLPGSRLGPPSSKPPSTSRVRSTPTPSVASHISKTSHSPSAHSDSSDAEGGGGGDSGGEAESHHSSSILSGTSPTLPNAESIGRGRSKTGSFSLGPGSAGGTSKPPKKVTGTGPPTKKQAPPTPQLPALPPPPPPPVRRPESNFLIDIEGEETGSDTD